MRKKSKHILGQMRNKLLYLTNEEKQIIIDDYLSGNETKQSVFERYTGYSTENGVITRWMGQLAIANNLKKNSNLVPVKNSTKKAPIDFEKLQLEKRVAELEKQVKLSEIKAIAFSTMVDIAEKEFNISIRKKYNTKL